MPYSLRNRKPADKAEEPAAVSPSASSPKTKSAAKAKSPVTEKPPKAKSPVTETPAKAKSLVAEKPAKATSPKPKPTSPSSPTKSHDFKTIHKKVVANIAALGPSVKKLAHRHTQAVSGKVAKKHQRISAVQSRVLKTILHSGVSSDVVRARIAVHAQVIKRGVDQQIKQLGKNPIARLATNSIRHGVPVAFITAPISGRVSKKVAGPAGYTKPKTTDAKRAATGEQIVKSVSVELKRLAAAAKPYYTTVSPSFVKDRASLFGAKVAVNSEVLKRASVHELLAKRRPVSPIRPKTISGVPSAAPKSPKRTTPVHAAL